MATTIARKFGTDLSNIQANEAKEKRVVKKASSTNVLDNGLPLASTSASSTPSLLDALRSETAVAKVDDLPLDEEVFRFEKPEVENKETTKEAEDPQRRFFYDRDFLLSFRENWKEPIELPAEIRRDALPPSRLATRTVFSNPTTPVHHSVKRVHRIHPASSSSLLSILASPGGGVVFAPTADGKYTLSEKNAHFLKNLKAPTAVTLPIAMNQSPMSKYVPPHKKTPEKAAPLFSLETALPLVGQIRAEKTVEKEPVIEKPVEKPAEKPIEAPAESERPKEIALAPPVKPDLAAMPKVITLEWKPKKVKKIKPRETDPKRLASRQKQIDIGKNTVGYKEYIAKVPKDQRKKTDPKTPDKYQICSKRSWDGQVRKWRRQLHAYDPPGYIPPADEDIDGTEENEASGEEDELHEVGVLPKNLESVFESVHTV